MGEEEMKKIQGMLTGKLIKHSTNAEVRSYYQIQLVVLFQY